MNYMGRLVESMIEANRKSYLYGCGKSWDNVKKRTKARMMPRGGVFNRLYEMERVSILNLNKSEYDELIKKAKEKINGYPHNPDAEKVPIFKR